MILIFIFLGLLSNHMCEQCVPGSLSSSSAREPGNEVTEHAKQPHGRYVPVSSPPNMETQRVAPRRASW